VPAANGKCNRGIAAAFSGEEMEQHVAIGGAGYRK
jgi:hypothetical protein